MPFLDFTCLSRNNIDIPLFYAGVDKSTSAQYRFHVYLVVIPKRGLEFKMAVTVGFLDISSMHIQLETPYVYNLSVYYLIIKLTGFC